MLTSGCEITEAVLLPALEIRREDLDTTDASQSSLTIPYFAHSLFNNSFRAGTMAFISLSSGVVRIFFALAKILWEYL